MPSTIGAYHQHNMCEASTRYVRNINTHVKDKKQELLRSLLPIGKIVMSNLCET